MLSLITTGRDDDYGHGFLDRLYLSIENNLKIIKEYNIPYEYIICEWNPERDYLINNPKFKKLFDDYNLREVIISKSVVTNEKLNEKVFYEYFAKNTGVRNASYDNILILNSDIVIPQKSFNAIISKVKEGLDPNNFYRLKYRDQIDNNFNFITSESIYYPQNPDAVICGFCSGDFLLLKKSTFIKNGQGYDECNVRHRTISQTGMDGEILWNMYFSGVRIHLIEENYQHINHGKHNVYDNHYNQSGYKNKPNWGFIDYEHEVVNEKLLVIK